MRKVKRTVITIKMKYTAYAIRLLIAAPFIPKTGIKLLFRKIDITVSNTENSKEKA